MPYCLGLHIEDNYIKYAKVLNEKNQIPKVEMYGVVFYDNLQMAIEQIIKETYSYGIDIATNLTNEFYDYFDEEFSGMNEVSLKKHLKLMFQEEVCAKRNINPNTIESRYITASKNAEDTMQIIYISANKSDISSRTQLLKGKVKKLLPTSIANTNLVTIDEKTNIAILNIDAFSTLTTIVKGEIKKVTSINVGMSNILSKLNQKYSSYSKSYSQCKKITLYDEKTKDLNSEENQSDVEDIMPFLYDIAQRVKGLLEEYIGIVNHLYITGTCVAINNIDLYFEDAIGNISVEILKPKQVTEKNETNKKIKELIEVNTAIALAVSSDKVDNRNINFLTLNPVNEILSEVKSSKYISTVTNKLKIKEKNPIEQKQPISFNLDSSNGFRIFGTVSRALLMLFATILAGYVFTTGILTSQYQERIDQIAEASSEIRVGMSTMTRDTSTIKLNTQKYKTLEENVMNLMEELNQINGISKDVPGFLSRVALVIPDNVYVTRIAINDEKVTIDAESKKYSDLGFFISSLKADGVLENVTTEVKSEKDTIQIVISGVIL